MISFLLLLTYLQYYLSFILLNYNRSYVVLECFLEEPKLIDLLISVFLQLLKGWMERECWICWEARDLFLLVIPSIGTCGNLLFASSEIQWKTKVKFLKQMEESILEEKPLTHSYSKLVLFSSAFSVYFFFIFFVSNFFFMLYV